MTAQPPLPLAPADATPIGAAAALLEDAEGGRVFIHGELAFAFDAGDAAGRRLAAVQLVRVRAASLAEVAAGFGVDQATVWRWRRRVAVGGVAGLGSDRRGPKGPSKLTGAVVARIRDLRGQEGSLRAIAEEVGVSVDSVRRALAGRPGADSADGVQSGQDAGGPGDGGGGLPLLADPPRRGAERGLARWGLLDHARPVFAPAGRVPLAGLLLALPGLEATGLLGCAREVFGSLPGGFYGLESVLVESVLRTLAGQPRAEGATRIDPVALGRVLGLDRAPEVKTVRRKLRQLAGLGRADRLIGAMAARRLGPARPLGGGEDVAAVLYVDGHVRAYHGRRQIAKTHLSRLRFPAPATLETWISDAAGDPVAVVMAEPAASLAAELRRLLPELRAAVGDGRRVLVGFDRGGWSPALFAHMDAAGFDVLTWRKGRAPALPEDAFSQHELVDPSGRAHRFALADTSVRLPIGDTGDALEMRQVTRRDETGKQAHILTTRTDLAAAEVVYRMGSRWRLENAFRYGRLHFDLDSHDSYACHGDDPDRIVPNPARKAAYQDLLAARARYQQAAADADAALLSLHTPASGTSALVTNQDYNAATAGRLAAQTALAAAEDAHRDTPPRLPLKDVSPGRQVLDTETKLLTHAIKIAAFNTTTALARDLRIHTGYARAAQEAHTLIRHALTHTGDIDPDLQARTLTIRLDPMPTKRATQAIRQLCEHLTATRTAYPDTDLTLRYQIKTHP